MLMRKRTAVKQIDTQQSQDCIVQQKQQVLFG